MRKVKLKSKKNTLPWLNDSILKLMKDRDHVLMLAVKNSQNSVNRHQFVSLR